MDEPDSYESSLMVSMLRQAEKYIVAVDNEEAIFVIELFLQAQFSEFMEIISVILSELVELDDDFSERAWPLQSRINQTPISAPFNPSKSEVVSRGGPSGSENVPPIPLTTRSRLRKMRILPSRMSAAPPSKVTTTEHSSLKTAPLRANFRSMSSLLLPATKNISPVNKEGDFSKKNLDFSICCSVADYIANEPDILSTEGLFRKPGNRLRIKNLYAQLCEFFNDNKSTSNMIRASTVLDVSPGTFNPTSSASFFVSEILSSAPPHDVTGVLLCALTSLHCDQGLLPHEITELLLKVTQLQYHLKDRSPAHSIDPSYDWPHRLCHARQLLACRIIIQFLLPKPERVILTKILSVLHKITLNVMDSKMTSESLARCLSNTLLGSPLDTEHVSLYIDTLINLIELSEDLEALPQFVYLKIKNVLQVDAEISVNIKHLKRKQSSDLESAMKKRSWATTRQVSLESPFTSTMRSRRRMASRKFFDLPHR
ncbi:hypothetical protein Aperf_G00000073643 [Anoplocephala perfoliata]